MRPSNFFFLRDFILVAQTIRSGISTTIIFIAKFRWNLPRFCRMTKTMQWERKTFTCGPGKNKIRADICFMVLLRC